VRINRKFIFVVPSVIHFLLQYRRRRMNQTRRVAGSGKLMASRGHVTLASGSQNIIKHQEKRNSVYTYWHACTHICIRTHIHHTYTHIHYTYTYMHACIHTYTHHTYIHTSYIHTYTCIHHTYTHACIHTYTYQTYIHTRMHACAHTCMHTYIHTFVRIVLTAFS
jgi:hypothetical protein